ncbi:MAG: alpha/beta hydrolase [Vicinamibacterales bacterium]
MLLMTRARAAGVMSVALVVLALSASAFAQRAPATTAVDPPRDAAHPARMEVLHIPSGGVSINGVAYLASGAGVHPTLVLLHGLPGNEKNLDLAQAVRRAGWNAVTLNYRGSWGSPGVFRFANNLEDAVAALAFIRSADNAARLGIDTSRIVLGGHSMGGWVTAFTAAKDPALAGALFISAADMGGSGGVPRASVVTRMAGNMEALAGVTAESMADEVIAHSDAWRIQLAAPGLARLPLLVLTSDDGLAPVGDGLAQTAREKGNSSVTTQHEATDHSWSDKRLTLANAVVAWLQQLK